MPTRDPHLELELYIKEDSPSCRRAAEAVARLLEGYDAQAFSYSVRNLTRVPLSFDEPPIALVPMLVIRDRRGTRVVSDLEDTTALEALLASANVTRRQPE